MKINKTTISFDSKTYFIADIAANHDGSLERAKKLIELAKESGADAVKLQHHNVKKYVSDYGFKQLGSKQSHQSSWKKSIFEVYKDAQVPMDWTQPLKEFSDQLEIDFFTTPYDLDIVDQVKPFVSAFKIGSGDLNWDAMLTKVAKTGKPVILATGASDIGEVQHAVQVLSRDATELALLQCNTNYTGSLENVKHINLRVLETYRAMFPHLLLGLSDHTPGHVTVLGAVALGARIIEKHFTDDNDRDGPDHPFSLNPLAWSEMVKQTRWLEASLGRGIKEVEENESETVVLQRRAIRVVRSLKRGETITRQDIEFQRPAPKECFKPNDVDRVLNRKCARDIEAGEYMAPHLLES